MRPHELHDALGPPGIRAACHHHEHYPFEPVLILFASGQPLAIGAAYATIGSICAGIAGFVDIRFLARVGSFAGRGSRWTPADLDRWWFYLVVFSSALLPIPYSIVRVALFRGRPHPALYAGVVAVGRFPRYLLTLYVWEQMTLPTWATAVLVVAALPWLIAQLGKMIAECRLQIAD